MGIRLAHPVLGRLGLPMEGGDNIEPFAGREIVSVARGSLGVSVRSKVPVWQADEVVGVVSTGYLMPQVWSLVGEVLIGLAPWFVLVLGLGTLGTVWTARRLRAEILNLEPEEIAALARQRGQNLLRTPIHPSCPATRYAARHQIALNPNIQSRREDQWRDVDRLDMRWRE